MAMSAAVTALVSPLTTATVPRALAQSCQVRRAVLLFALSALPKSKGRFSSVDPVQNLKSQPWSGYISDSNLRPQRGVAFIFVNSLEKFCRSAAFTSGGGMVAVETKTGSNSSEQDEKKLDEFPATELGYFQDMFVLQAPATFVGVVQEGERLAVIVDRTILYPQGGGQPCDTGYITSVNDEVKFRVEDVRAKNGLVYHYGNFDSSEGMSFQRGQEVLLKVDSSRRLHNSRLHSAGHLLDACMKSVGLLALEPGKGHHFPDGPFVEYKGTIPASDIERKRDELEAEASRLVKTGGSVQAVVAPYEEAADLCGGVLPHYIAKESSPRIVTVGGLGCPCGGTHVADITEIGNIKVTQIRVKKGMTKVSYSITADAV